MATAVVPVRSDGTASGRRCQMYAEPKKSSQSPTVSEGKSVAAERKWEDRPGWASCFPPRSSKIEHPPDFTGVTVIDGQKYWVNVYDKLDKNGSRYVSVNLRKWEER